MTIPEYTKETLARLQILLRGVLDNPRSDFYRAHFAEWTSGDGLPHTLHEWQSLPFLSREQIVKWNLWDRTFVDRKKIYAIRNTNGTTERKPLFTPRRTFGDCSAMPRRAGIRRQLSFLTVLYLSEMPRRGNTDMIFLNCVYPESPEDFRLAAVMAKRFNADSLGGMPSLMIQLAPYMKKAGVIEQIESLELVGDRCTEAQRRALLSLYNNPRLCQNYSAAEWSGIYGIPCSYTLEKRSLSFHISDTDIFSEFIDPETGIPKEPGNEPTELVVSSFSPEQPFPLIRYRTGDLVMLESAACSCAWGSPRFLMVGRTLSDKVRFLNGEFSVIGIEQALLGIPEAGVKFEAHYYERFDNEGNLKPQLELRIMPRKPLNIVAVREQLAQALHYTPKDSYADAVARGFLGPLEVSLLEHPTRTVGGKRVRLFRHT